MTAAEVGAIGEKYVTAWLGSKGYSCYRNTQLPGSTDIEANGSPNKLLVQVKTAVFPNSAASLSADEQKNIVARANQNVREAWLAQLEINADGAQRGEIRWSKLN